jgi:hypothetical protein
MKPTALEYKAIDETDQDARLEKGYHASGEFHRSKSSILWIESR